jgi:hypothetical protein
MVYHPNLGAESVLGLALAHGCRLPGTLAHALLVLRNTLSTGHETFHGGNLPGFIALHAHP